MRPRPGKALTSGPAELMREHLGRMLGTRYVRFQTDLGFGAVHAMDNVQPDNITGLVRTGEALVENRAVDIQSLASLLVKKRQKFDPKRSCCHNLPLLKAISHRFRPRPMSRSALLIDRLSATSPNVLALAVGSLPGLVVHWRIRGSVLEPSCRVASGPGLRLRDLFGDAQRPPPRSEAAVATTLVTAMTSPSMSRARSGVGQVWRCPGSEQRLCAGLLRSCRGEQDDPPRHRRRGQPQLVQQ